jgi:hypothetical protein
MMSGETANLVLEQLRALRGGVEALRDDMREIKGRLGVLEAGYASLQHNMDRVGLRLDRIERRLDLREG